MEPLGIQFGSLILAPRPPEHIWSNLLYPGKPGWAIALYLAPGC